MNEAKTRKDLIDKQLQQAGWNITDQTQVGIEYNINVGLPEGVNEPQTPYQGYQYSDYVLYGKDGKVLAVVEAKKTSVNAELGREQAKQYCQNIQNESGGELPFCFYTNGHEIFYWDLGNYPPKKVIGFPTRDDLERYSYIRRNRKPLAQELINTDIAGRDYQIHAIRSVMEGIEKKRQKFLLVMATGTGKTRTTIAMVDALMRAGWAERVLFLVDRIALRNQALEAFKEFLPNEPRWPKVGEKEIAKDRRIYTSTYPTMLNIIRDEEYSLSPHFFDLIVIDESHRSIYNTYQEVLDYFNTTTLGLTATPTDVIDHNTFKLFECEDGLPSFAYSYEEAVNNIPPYLCDFQVMKIQTKFQEDGISKRTISLEDQKNLILQGKEVAEINFEGTDLEKSVINKGTNVTIVKEFMEESIKDPNGVLPGKTIFFCSTKAHARRIEKIFDSLYPEYTGELAKVIVSDDPRVYGKGGLLHQFTHNDMPRVAVSVDMLDTGIDVRELVNLVFVKPVYSYTKFWQMIGRGTRLLEPTKMKPWCAEKDAFLILDCWDNFEYFKLNPKGKQLKGQIPLPVRFVGIRIDKIETALEKEEPEIGQKEIEKLRSQISELPKKSVVIQDSKPDLAKVEDDAFWNHLTPEKIEFLRHTIKPLFRTVSQSDFKAMRFNKDILEISLVHLLEETEKYDTLKENIITVVSELPMSINIVAKNEDYIKKVLTNNFWSTVLDEGFDVLAKTLSPLIKYREQKGPLDGPSKLNLQDVIQTKEMVEFGPKNEAVSISKYREMVEAKIAELIEKNPILQKIKSGEQVTEEEAEQLAEELHEEDPHITEQLLRKVYNHQKAKFIQFIKHILGIEILESFDAEVSRLVQAFIKEHSNLSTRQIEFLNLLKDYIIERGEIEKRDLISSPFTIIHPKGIRGVFTPSEIKEILALTEKFAA
ncbi:DEAD/DEAH box helicase family protein [Maribacter polysiphoniae]|uniref:DEAD/DEAH box helicase family protein n=1 Tax=Maribacter polysiphoniae TaxID=429344 RepID=A0A316DZI6_9FLAO|nr:DEAD/DEAH box helicase family protein [Maribacter polysiphoniae]MBD1261516.1 DEAD/DEAH box helicase family protein [Maribacter polysiphoniae]PWK22848.1 type I restriction enzyme R subunit [Maribacter polysiphoniae]